MTAVTACRVGESHSRTVETKVSNNPARKFDRFRRVGPCKFIRARKKVFSGGAAERNGVEQRFPDHTAVKAL